MSHGPLILRGVMETSLKDGKVPPVLVCLQKYVLASVNTSHFQYYFSLHLSIILCYTLCIINIYVKYTSLFTSIFYSKVM